MEEDAKEYAKKCDKCQRHAPAINVPANDLTPILNPIPFAQWGMDILGPFKLASGGRKYLIVAIDYFTKWIEAHPTVKITQGQVKNFIWENIITRFGIPLAIVFDHGKQFDAGDIQRFLSTYQIKFAYSSVCHPQSNGQAEAANKSILTALKKKLDDLKGLWADLVAEVLWSNRTAVKDATGFTPFRLVYGTEALLPVELSIPSLRIKYFQPDSNYQNLKEALDFVPGARLAAELRQAACKARMAKVYNRRVRRRELKQGDLVLRRTAATGKADKDGKLTANWEGPYSISKVIGPGTFELSTVEGQPLTNTWNADVLRKYHLQD